MFEISDELAQDVLNYLAKQPFIEVVDMINRLQQMKRVEPKNDKVYSEDTVIAKK
jgi:hypothetical protein